MKAMILAAGRGERMRPLTDRLPKPLLEAGGKPLIVHLIETLRRAGFAELVINHAHLGPLLEARLGDGGALGVSIAWSPEPHALETAGGIANALPLLGAAPFLCVNADVYTDLDFARLPVAITPRRAHLVLVDNPAHHPQGDFGLDARSGLVTSGARSRLTYSGIAVLDPSLFAAITPGTIAKLAPLLTAAIARGEVSGEHHQGLWHDIGTPERLAALDALLARGG